MHLYKNVPVSIIKADSGDHCNLLVKKMLNGIRNSPNPPVHTSYAEFSINANILGYLEWTNDPVNVDKENLRVTLFADVVLYEPIDLINFHINIIYNYLSFINGVQQIGLEFGYLLPVFKERDLMTYELE